MSNFEIFLIVMLCATPIIALFFILPKKLKKEKKVEKTEVKTLKEVKQEESKPVVEEKKIEPKKVASSEISTDDFKSYLNHRTPTSKPSRVELPKDFRDMSLPYRPRRREKKEKPKTIVEEIQSLSPELKALMITGVLDRKNFDN